MVQREWDAAQRRSVNDALLAKLAAKYKVRIEGPYSELLMKGGRMPPSPGPN
jgi:hypothetical protein